MLRGKMRGLDFCVFVIIFTLTNGYPELEWPEKYSCKITKYSLLSDRIENIQYWRNNHNSRIEYNNGSVVKYAICLGDSEEKALRFKIHPETYDAFDKDYLNKLVCHYLDEDSTDTDPDDILPRIEDYYFKVIGEQKVRNEYCVKFEAIEESEKQTIWAVYTHNDEEADSGQWRPVRYEYIEYDTWRDSIVEYDVWDFDNFETEFDDFDVFRLPQACTTSKGPVIHNMHDESVTKHLMFMNHHNKKHVDHVFKAFKTKFARSYGKVGEHDMRKKLFQRRMRLIIETNRKNLPYKLAVNHFADRTPEEMKKYTGRKPRPLGENATHPFPHTDKSLMDVLSDLPKEFDARSEGLVGPVQDQGDCGSCWIFGTTAAAEGALARKNGKLMRLANQALVDCAWEFGAQGCDGGTDSEAFKFMIKYGMPTVADYGEYVQVDGFCNIANIESTYKITGYVDVTPNSVNALKVALYENGPLSSAIAVSDSFFLYSSGIFYDTDCKSNRDSLDHEIAVVGYGEQYGETFWVLKNSWGKSWGISGFMQILAKDNNCGVMTEPTYVVV